jgi:hypothetical protein
MPGARPAPHAATRRCCCCWRRCCCRQHHAGVLLPRGARAAGQVADSRGAWRAGPQPDRRPMHAARAAASARPPVRSKRPAGRQRRQQQPGRRQPRQAADAQQHVRGGAHRAWLGRRRCRRAAAATGRALQLAGRASDAGDQHRGRGCGGGGVCACVCVRVCVEGGPCALVGQAVMSSPHASLLRTTCRLLCAAAAAAA